MSEVKDWCEKPRVTETMGNGWCVRINGTDVFDSINQYGCKTLRSMDIVKGLGSKEEAEAYLAQWLKDQLPDFDAQRLRADTAEAENRILRHSNASFLETVAKVCDLLGIDLDDAKHADGQPSDVLFIHAKGQAEKLAAAEQRIAELTGLLRSASEELHDFITGSLLDRIDAALNPNPEAESHE